MPITVSLIHIIVFHLQIITTQKFIGFFDLRVINKDRVQLSKGFEQHPHKNMEIFSYVLERTIEY